MVGMAYGSLITVRIFVFCLGSITKSKFQDETEAALGYGGMSTASLWKITSFSPANVCYPGSFKGNRWNCNCWRARTFMQRALYVEQINDDLLRSDLSKQ